MNAVFNRSIQTSAVNRHPGSKFILPIKSPLMACYLTASNIVSVTVFEIFAAKIPDLDLGRFKVIQSQSSRWKPISQTISHRWFPIRLLLTPSSYPSHF